jgi:hypothetical protein
VTPRARSAESGSFLIRNRVAFTVAGSAMKNGAYPAAMVAAAVSAALIVFGLISRTGRKTSAHGLASAARPTAAPDASGWSVTAA